VTGNTLRGRVSFRNEKPPKVNFFGGFFGVYELLKHYIFSVFAVHLLFYANAFFEMPPTLSRDRNKIERFFSRLKPFRRLATRYEKTASSFLGMVHFVSALLWLR
jgi:hypothetical protein